MTETAGTTKMSQRTRTGAIAAGLALLLPVILVAGGTSAIGVRSDTGILSAATLTWSTVAAGDSIAFPAINASMGGAILLQLCDFTFNGTSTISDSGGDLFMAINWWYGYDPGTGDIETQDVYAALNVAERSSDVVTILNNGSVGGAVFGTAIAVSFVTGLHHSGGEYLVNPNGSWSASGTGPFNITQNVSAGDFVLATMNAAESGNAHPMGGMVPDSRFTSTAGVPIDSPGDALITSSVSYYNATATGSLAFRANYSGFNSPPVVYVGMLTVWATGSSPYPPGPGPGYSALLALILVAAFGGAFMYLASTRWEKRR